MENNGPVCYPGTFLFINGGSASAGDMFGPLVSHKGLNRNEICSS
jgi:ribosomal protein L11